MSCETTKQSYLDSYEVAVEKIRQSQPELSEHDVRVAAAARFLPKHRRLTVAGHIENGGKERYKNGEFIMVGEKMYFPSTGESAEELHENQLISSQLHHDPTRYSRLDHETTLLIQSSIANGATVVRTSFDGKDGVHRDMLEYRYDPVANQGEIVVHDMSKTNGALDFAGMKQAVQVQSPGFHMVSQSEKVFVMTDTPTKVNQATYLSWSIDGSALWRIDANRGKEEPERFTAPHPAPSLVRAKIQDKPERQAGQTPTLFASESPRQLAPERILPASVARRMRSLSGEDGLDNHRLRKAQERLVLGKVSQKSVRLEAIIKKPHKEIWQGVRALAVIAKTGFGAGAASLILASLGETPPQPVRVAGRSLRRHERKARMVREVRSEPKPREKGSIKHAKERYSTGQPRTEQEASKSEGKEVQGRRSERPGLIRRSKKDYIKARPVKAERQEPLIARKKEMPLSRHEKKTRKRRRNAELSPENRSFQRSNQDKSVNKNAVGEILTTFPSKEERRRRRRWRARVARGAQKALEKKLILNWEKKMRVELAPAAFVFEQKWVEKRAQRRNKYELPAFAGMTGERRKINVKVQKTKHDVFEGMRWEDGAATTSFWFTWIVWTILTRGRAEKNGVNFPPVGSRLTTSESLPVHEETPWLLLSIICYLTAMREQAFSIPNIKYLARVWPRGQILKRKRRGRTFKKPQIAIPSTLTPLPSHGIIFAAYS